MNVAGYFDLAGCDVSGRSIISHQVSQIERTGGLEPSQYANVFNDLPDTNAALLYVDVCVDVVGSWKCLFIALLLAPRCQI
jgi:hypothetical protein